MSMMHPSEDADWKFKLSMGKIPVVLLNQTSDFLSWHLALRRLVNACNMADILLFTVPNNQLAAVKERIQATADMAQHVKREAEEKMPAASSSSTTTTTTTSSTSKTTPIFLDLTEEKELSSASRTESEIATM